MSSLKFNESENKNKTVQSQPQTNWAMIAGISCGVITLIAIIIMIVGYYIKKNNNSAELSKLRNILNRNPIK